MESGQGGGKRLKAPALFAFLCLSLFLGCVHHPPVTPRPQIAYLHWLEKQSFLGRAPALIEEVSQTNRVWQHGAQPEHPHILLTAAPYWLYVTGPKGSENLFRSLKRDFTSLKERQIKGVYIAELGEDLDIWTNPSPDAQTGRNLYLDRDMDFEKFLASAENANIQTGSPLLPAATGIGPDFILQARNAAAHKGLYAMLSLPDELARQMPEAAGEWDCQPLTEANLDLLVEAGILPTDLYRDHFEWGERAGWALTGKVLGVDGHPRRWVYRFENTPLKPVLLWQDPSGATKQALAADVIKHTGLEGQALTGLNFSPWLGLEPFAPDTAPLPYSHALEALNACALQIHQYGGWALQADPIPLDALLAVLKTACDFCRDDIMPQLFIYAILTEDAVPLKSLFTCLEQEKADVRRLAHGFSPIETLDHSLLRPSSLTIEASINFNFQNLQPVSFTELANTDIIKISRLLWEWLCSNPGLKFYPVEWSQEETTPGSHLPDRLLLAAEREQLPLGQLHSSGGSGKNVIFVKFKLPDGKIWLTTANFGKEMANLSVPFQERLKSAYEPGSQANLNDNILPNRQNFRLLLDGQQVRNVVFELD